jgi:TldD protein
MDRREFIISTGVLTAGIATGCAPRTLLDAEPEPGLAASSLYGEALDLALQALDAARRAGASYADVRVQRNRQQFVATRERRIAGLADTESMGFGLRVIADGSWGFAASSELRPDEVERVARLAVAQARQHAPARRRPLELAPVESYPEARWRSPIEIDPFDVSVEDKVALLLAANEAALGVRGARFVNSSVVAVRQERLFASTEGTVADQTLYRINPSMSITAVAPDGSDFQSRSATDAAPMGLGWEYVLGTDLVGNAPRWAEDAVRKLGAPAVEPGTYDLVLLPSHLWLTIHESIAHPTELDRVMGYEANFAGTSFIHPVEDFLGTFRYGREFMQIQGERSTPGALSTIGWDDEGVQPVDYLIVRDGLLWDLQTSREEAPWLADWYARTGREVRSHGQSYAQSWADIQFHRMPNINLLPNAERDVSVEELVSGIRRGILIDGDGSFSIDQQRYNAQFGGQVFHEIRDGRVVGTLKDVAYQLRTPEFWNSMDEIGGRSTYGMGGSFFDGKGQPSQANAVSHGCPAARFRGVNVINTGRQV